MDDPLRVRLGERAQGLLGRLDRLVDPNAAQPLDALAEACQTAGEATDAIRLYRRVVAARERVQGPADLRTLETCQKLGDVYLASKKFKDALASYKRVVDGREKALGPVHPGVGIERADAHFHVV